MYAKNEIDIDELFCRKPSGASKMETRSAHKGPVSKFRSGRFQVSLWECRRGLRACVQCSRFNKLLGEWENQSIWCDPHELRDLAGALDQVSV